MLNNTRLAAIAFEDNGVSYRVYYQDSANMIKESCYDEASGWYTRENCIVAHDAKKHSPIAATSWAGGNEIRIYYVNNGNKIMERKWSVDDNSDVTFWKESIDVKSVKPGPQSRLAISRTETVDGDIQLRLFYQSANHELRQTSYNSSAKAEWADAVLESDRGNVKAFEGSSLAAFGDSTLWLFYQATNRDVEVLKEEGRKWRHKKLSKVSVLEKTPITVAPLLSQDEPESSVSVYLVGRDGKILPKKFDLSKDNWMEVQPTEEPKPAWPSVHKGSAIAAAGLFEGESSIFYQPSPTTIAQHSVDKGFQLPLGIPTSLGGDLRTYRQMLKKAQMSSDSMMIGLVRARDVDLMDESTRSKFVRRLTETISGILGNDAWSNSSLRPQVEQLCREFDLGIIWQGDDSKWFGRDGNTCYSSATVSTNPLQVRLEAAMGRIAIGSGTPQYINQFMYYNTLYQLCRYVGVGGS